MKKKLLLLLVFCLAAALLLVTGAAADDTLTGTCGEGVTWTATETKNAYREGYDMTIAGTDTGYPGEQLTIEAPNFGDTGLSADDIVRVDIGGYGDRNTYIIGEGAFEGFTNLRELNVYSVTNLKSIGANAFADSSYLTTILFGSDFTYWYGLDVADEGNSYLLAVEPVSGCTITLPDSNGNTWTIEYNNFTDLLDMEATATVTKGENGNGVALGFPGEERGMSYSQPRTDITELTIGEGITAYNKLSTGSDIPNLEKLTIGNDLVTIGEGAFNNVFSDSLTVIFGDESNLKTIGNGAFGFTDLTTITLPDSVETIGDNAFSNCDKLTSVTLGSGLKSIGNYAFNYCSALSSINIPEGVTFLGNSAFNNCTSLESINIPGSVNTIGNSAFWHCTALEELTINSGVETIDVSAFNNCTSLTSVSIPGSVKTIGNSAFNGCTSLETLSLGSGVETIGSSAFQNCAKLKDFTLPSGLKSIGDSAFNGCAALTKVDMPDSVTYLGAGAYQNCTGLTSVTLSEKLSEMNNSVFAGCTGLTTVTLPDLVNNIGNYLFQGCSKLASVYTGDYIQFVGSSNFDGCSDSLTVYGYPGSYMEVYCETYDINFAARSDAPASGAGIENITSSTGVNPETGEVCTVITITLSDGRTQKFYLDNEVNSIEDITSRPGFDPDGKPCTVVTITMTNGDVERFYVYDGKDGEDGETVVTPIFNDVPATAYYADAVAWAVANGITSGTDENTFSPNAPCTRAQVVTFLWRAMGSPEPRSAGTFTDVNVSSYYAKAVRWALENGITSGTSATTFDPNAVCTRAQVVTFLMRALDGRSYGSAGFADVAASSYYADAVAWAVANGITDGTGATTFSPDTQCNRAQIVTFLYRAVA